MRQAQKNCIYYKNDDMLLLSITVLHSKVGDYNKKNAWEKTYNKIFYHLLDINLTFSIHINLDEASHKY